MFRITQNCIYLIFEDGRSAPFDANDFGERLKRALSNVIDLRDSTIVADITTAVELALTANRPADALESVKISVSALDDLTVRLLQNAGLSAAAEEYRKSGYAGDGLQRVPLDRMRAFLLEKLDWNGYSDESVSRISEKVQNTMMSIGASESSPELAIELAKHFRLADAGKIELHLQAPKYMNSTDAAISAEEICANLSDGTKALVTKRILKLYPVNLNIIAALRIDVRLTGIATENELTAPLLEMTLEPAFVNIGKAVDEICLVADRLFQAHGHDAVAQVLLNVTDGYPFTSDWMGCLTDQAREKCAIKLCRMLAGEFSRPPLRITCN